MPGPAGRKTAAWAPPFLAGLAFLIASGVGAAFVRLDERSRQDLARRAVSEVGLTRVSEIEKQLDRVFASAFALAVSIGPAADGSRFADVAPEVLRKFPTVGMLAFAPNGVVRDIHPPAIEGEQAGRDLFADAREAPEARAARDARSFRLAGPFPRGRSGPVIVGYLPVWRSGGPGQDTFVGFVIAAVRVSDLVSASDLAGLALRGYDYNLARAGARGPAVTFARSTELDLDDPVQVAVKLPGGEWTFSIAPRQGWAVSSAFSRALGLALVMGLVVGLCVYDILRRPELLRREVELRTTRLVEANRQVTKEVLQRERAEQKLLHDASHDALTGLPNRAFLLSQIARALELAKREPSRNFAVLLLGLDRFTVVNDSRGPTAGDTLLKGVARCLENALRPDDVPVRLGGDEFGVLLSKVSDEERAKAVGYRLLGALSSPFDLDGAEVFISASAGVVVSSLDSERAEDVLRDAGLAIHRAKSAGGNRVEVFAREMHEKAVHLVNVEADLRLAIERDELRAYYQPVISLATGRITSFEALARWEHPLQGLVSPAVFIPVAESTGLVVQVDRCVWRAAARQIRELHQRMPQQPPVSVSVNLSTRQLTEPDLVDCVAKVLEQSGLSPSFFRLEITESMMMENSATAVQILKDLKALGIRLLLDDFGTGYSSLSYLHELPVDVLKIDRSFINLLSSGDRHTEIVRTIISLGKQLGLDVIAEGLSTEDQFARLRDLGCPYGQGFLISRPVPASQLEDLMTSQYEWTWASSLTSDRLTPAKA